VVTYFRGRQKVLKKIILISISIFSLNAEAHLTNSLFHLHQNDILFVGFVLSLLLLSHKVQLIFRKGDLNV
tara:strand:- start:804 stop:1016 length:213 start_codon:yes stop_codon:yes gene_type:complete